MRATLVAALTAALLLSVTARATAVSLRDIVELTRAGLDPDVLIALIEVDDHVYRVDAQGLLELKTAGVDDRVLVALIRSGRQRPAPASPRSVPREPTTFGVPQPGVEPPAQVRPEPRAHHQTQTTIVQVPVIVGGSAFLPRATHGTAAVAQDPARFSSFGTGFGRTTRPTDSPLRGYWGWGGQLRPGAWGQPRKSESASSESR